MFVNYYRKNINKVREFDVVDKNLIWFSGVNRNLIWLSTILLINFKFGIKNFKQFLYKAIYFSILTY